MAASRYRAVVLTVFIVLYGYSVFISGDDHGHSHSEPAGYKYSREANEAAAAAQGPEKTHSHSHGHSHDADDHSHSHSHEQKENTGHGHSHNHDEGQERSFSVEDKKTAPGFDPLLWAKALGATALISVTPVFILIFIPVEDANEKHQPLLKVLLAFASGGLLGDAFLHLIPHAVSPHSHGDEGHSHGDGGHSHGDGGHHGHSHGGGDHGHHMTVGLWVLGGILAFLCVEKFVRLVKGEHSHSHSHSSPKPAQPKNDSKKEDKAKQSDDEVDDSNKDAKNEKENNDEISKGSLRIAGYLNLAADFAHNFTDGLAIGASFLAGHTVGVITTITILLHEVPHEIGDFAILVQSGCSKKKAMMLQFTTAIGAMCGTLLSLTAGGIGTEATLWVLPFTAGGFIYIATVSVIPELLEDTKLGQSIKEIIALLVGVYMMVLIAQYE